MSLEDDDDLSWYARKAARSSLEFGAPEEAGSVERMATLLKRLRAAGIRGDASTMTLYTRRLPPGCRSCLRGEGTNVYVTGLCTRDCFFCFNQKPRTDELVVHGFPVREPEDAAGIAERFGLRSVGLSGGEPLLRPERVLRVLRALKAMPRPPRVDLYTNGDKVTPALLAELKAAGLDAIRFDLVARDFDLTPVALARRVFDEVAVEIPVVPAQLPRLKTMCLELDALGVPFLNIHELFVSPDNADRVLGAGEGLREGAPSRALLWRPAARSLECCLELLAHAQETCRKLSVYLCSCGTQETIAARGLARRRAALAAS